MIKDKHHIAIFASGSGTNAENIITYFKYNDSIRVSLILSNNPAAGVLQRAENIGIETFVFNREEFYSGNKVTDKLSENKIDFVVLAGFLWLVPENILSRFQHKIINIHPALLPGYGGKGMYGHRVHQAVKDNNERKTGITIHFVNKVYDDGDIIFQAQCDIDPQKESIEEIAAKVHRLEYEYYPKVIEKVLLSES